MSLTRTRQRKREYQREVHKYQQKFMELEQEFYFDLFDETDTRSYNQLVELYDKLMNNYIDVATWNYFEPQKNLFNKLFKA